MKSENKKNDQDPNKLVISPETKIGRLLDTYPHLEKLLVSLTPEFGKLNNPIIRRTVAKVANLKQAAEIGKIPLENLINKLRKAVGQNEWENSAKSLSSLNLKTPEWFKKENIIISIDARPILERGEHPVDSVLREVENLKNDEILELLSPFRPQPLIDLITKKGLKIWTKTVSSDFHKTYIRS